MPDYLEWERIDIPELTFFVFVFFWINIGFFDEGHKYGEVLNKKTDMISINQLHRHFSKNLINKLFYFQALVQIQIISNKQRVATKMASPHHQVYQIITIQQRPQRLRITQLVLNRRHRYQGLYKMYMFLFQHNYHQKNTKYLI